MSQGELVGAASSHTARPRPDPHRMEKQSWAKVTPGSSPAGRRRGRGAKACRPAYEAAGVIRISDDSSTESDAGLDSDFHSSPESLVDDDVVIVDTIGLPADDRGETCDPHSLLYMRGVGAERGSQHPTLVSSKAGFIQTAWG